MNVGQDIRLTRHDTTTDIERRITVSTVSAVSWKLIVFYGNGSRPPKWSAAAVIASSPSDVSRAGQSVSDSRTLGTCRRDLAATTASSPAIGGNRNFHS